MRPPAMTRVPRVTCRLRRAAQGGTLVASVLLLMAAQHADALTAQPRTAAPVFASIGAATCASYAADSAQQGDGKLVVVGGGREDFAAARYTSDGRLDPSFGAGGITTIDFVGALDEAEGVAIQADGKIVVAGRAGTTTPNGSDFAVTRLNSDGSLDPTFGAGGKAMVDMGGQAYVGGVALAPDGKIVVAGWTTQSGDFQILRLAANGTLDSAFATGGKASVDFGLFDQAFAVAVQPDNKTVLVGRSQLNSGDNAAMARFNSNGTADTSFNGDGRRVLPAVQLINGIAAGYQSVAVQSDGKLVAGGGARLERFNTDGSLDATFGQGGRIEPGANSAIFSVRLQPDGRIVAAGEQGFEDFLALRYTASGAPDATFNATGRLTVDLGGEDAAYGTLIQADGKILLVGIGGETRADPFAPLNGSMSLVRLTVGGALDSTFSDDGKQSTVFGCPTTLPPGDQSPMGSIYNPALVSPKVPPEGKAPAPSQTARTKPVAIDTPRKASRSALRRGVLTTLRGLRPGSKVRLRVRLRGRLVASVTTRADGQGTAKLRLKIVKNRLRQTRGRTLSLRYNVVARGGNTREITRTLKVT